MTNLFLKVNKDLFGIGLSPIEILIVAQVLEYQTKNMDCFISDESFANDFGVSQSTISRAISGLKKKNILAADVKNTQKGKLRYLTVLTAEIEERAKRQNDSCENEDSSLPNSQIDSCGNVNLPISNKQNDSIKDKLKDNTIKDNSTMDHPKGKVELVCEMMKNSTSSSGEFKF